MCPNSGVPWGTGCPEDFFYDCSSQTEIIDFIKSKNFNDLVYKNAKEEVGYFSACSNLISGLLCILEKNKEVVEKTQDVEYYCTEEGNPCDNNLNVQYFDLQ
uniref:Uncharacterized protein n=1 Tax=Panagrolaimus davidi TaxID=227884 RepID=A0A914R099_9BILA